MNQLRVSRTNVFLLLVIALLSTASSANADQSVQTLVCNNCLNWCMTGLQNGGTQSNYQECTLGCQSQDNTCIAPPLPNFSEYLPPAPVAPEAPATSPENPSVAFDPFAIAIQPEPETCPGGSGSNRRCFAPGISEEAQKLVNERDLALADQKRFENEKKDLQFRLMLAYSQGDKKEIHDTEKLLKKADKNMLKAEAEVAKYERKLAALGLFIPAHTAVVAN